MRQPGKGIAVYNNYRALAYEFDCVIVTLTDEAFVAFLDLSALPMIQCWLVFLVHLSNLFFWRFRGYMKHAGTWCCGIWTNS